MTLHYIAFLFSNQTSRGRLWQFLSNLPHGKQSNLCCRWRCDTRGSATVRWLTENKLHYLGTKERVDRQSMLPGGGDTDINLISSSSVPLACP